MLSVRTWLSCGASLLTVHVTLTCDDVRCAASHVIFVWTFTGHDATTGNPLKIRGWEEWEIGDDLKVIASRGWFDAQDYGRQVEGA